jgi:hypothetical protein
MEHPFVPSLEKKTLEELQKTMGELLPKLTFAYRTNNGPLIHQLQMVLESYRAEHTKKMNAQMEKMLEKQQLPIHIEKKL